MMKNIINMKLFRSINSDKMEIIMNKLLILITFFFSVSFTDPLQDYLVDVLHMDRYMYIQPIAQVENPLDPTWEKFIYDPEDAACIHGHEWHIDTRTNDQNNIMIMLKGGGACYPSFDNCQKTAQHFETKDDDLTSFQPWNPLAGVSIVGIPYCDGSAFLGDAEADWDGDGIYERKHYGLRNLSTGISMAKAKFPNAQNIFITGSSAGGFGTIPATAMVRMAYPEANIYVFNESGQGITDPFDHSMWDFVSPIWNALPNLSQVCYECYYHPIMIINEQLYYDTKLWYGYYSSYYDNVIKEYVQMDYTSFRYAVETASSIIANNHPNKFHRYLIEGDSHTIDDYQQGVSEWIREMVTHDPSWDNYTE
jgi:hypothetical protein